MRIIAGRFRGRALRAPKGLDTRPTMDRAREAIFQILGDLSEERVLDLYAGTGAMGLEALSRGAAHATFVESDRKAMDAIRKNVEAFGIASQCTFLEMPLARSKKRLEALGPFDLVLSDPPWAISQDSAVEVAALVKGLLSPNARVLLGHPAQSPVEVPASDLTLTDRRKWGGTGMSFYVRSAP